ncbi:2637_t:CDS:1 [Ambispora gerdemannii]|uniref:2637_t:CDS:1 n=1 Tax=Ambispora gerdemannii TaxID=144530 RepID=A0A9N9GTU6_9GLOM|nr:2637_t:CDS:1 [Ambispora gerdemannii]
MNDQFPSTFFNNFINTDASTNDNDNNIKYNDKNMGEENDDENYFSNALKELLQEFSSIKNPGGRDEHLQECIQSWFSRHIEYTEIKVIEYLKQIAHKNYDYACLLGFLYHTEFDWQKAFEWYLRAAEHNNAFGQNQVGYFYQKGYGIGVNHQNAFYWYQKSSDGGCSNAKSNLGYCYHYGIHVKRNSRYAFYWYSKSAEIGDELGMCNLANALLHGIGTNVDVHQTLRLYRDAKNLKCLRVDEYLRYIFVYRY